MCLSSFLGMDEPQESVVEEEKQAKITPFDFVNNINFGKVDIFLEDGADKAYTPYIINRALSFSQDVVIYANEMNRFSNVIPKYSQFKFYLNAIRKRKRYDKWVKAEKEADDISVIKEYYGYNNEKAKHALQIITPIALENIKQKLNKGGIQPKKGKKNE